MYLPDQENKLKDVIEHAYQAYAAAMDTPLIAENEIVKESELIKREAQRYSKAEALAFVKLLNVDGIGAYIAHNLSDMERLSQVEASHKTASAKFLGTSEEEVTELQEFLKNHPSYSKTFSAIIQSIQHYIQDMEEIADQSDYVEIPDLVERLKTDSFNGLFVKALMGRMLLAFPKDEWGPPTDQTGKEGVTHAFAKLNFFTEGDTQCPMSRRIRAIFDLKTDRDPETGKVEVTGSEQGALLVSMYQDFENKIWGRDADDFDVV